MTKQAVSVHIFNEPGLLYDADQQCALSYGNGAIYCKNKSPEVWTKYQVFHSIDIKKFNILTQT